MIAVVLPTLLAKKAIIQQPTIEERLIAYVIELKRGCGKYG